MRISELSRASGVPVATIKYYLREGLLPSGEATARNQAHYAGEHLQRLRLIRVLREVGNLGISQMREILAALGDEGVGTHELLGVAHRALAPAESRGPSGEDVARARSDVDRFVGQLGWTAAPQAPARRMLADALVALRRLGADVGPEVFVPYARAAEQIAEREVALLPEEGERAETLSRMVVGTVVFEAALTALRRLAQEHHSRRRFQAGSARR